jgi:pimeloyl-ACP methyl ester carboxylesterase
MSDSTVVHPFRVHVPQEEIDDLNDRLDRARGTNVIPGSGDEYGVSLEWVQRLARYWRHEFDWRAFEARLNRYPQFTTVIDGQQIHFLHVRSGRQGALGLILTHGWPGSVVEFLDVIDPLTAAGYDVVVPSLPGIGFSGPTTDRGWGVDRTARAWVELMRRLGYDRYGAVGNDGGSMISPMVGRLDPEHVVGVHVTQVFSFPTGDPAELEGMSDAEVAGMERLKWFWDTKGAFNILHSQQPQTVAHALADSPVGLLAWNGQLLGGLDDEFVISNVATYWFTGTSGSAIRFYYENAHVDSHPTEPTTVPLALAGSLNDFISIRRFADRDHANIVSWHMYDKGGHYTAHVEPELMVKDITEFFAKVA